jgi:hypothetical protein
VPVPEVARALPTQAAWRADCEAYLREKSYMCVRTADTPRALMKLGVSWCHENAPKYDVSRRETFIHRMVAELIPSLLPPSPYEEKLAATYCNSWFQQQVEFINMAARGQAPTQASWWGPLTSAAAILAIAVTICAMATHHTGHSIYRPVLVLDMPLPIWVAFACAWAICVLAVAVATWRLRRSLTSEWALPAK